MKKYVGFDPVMMVMALAMVTAMYVYTGSNNQTAREKTVTIAPIPEGYRPYTKAEISEHLLRPMRTWDGTGLDVIVDIYSDREVRRSQMPSEDCVLNVSGVMPTTTANLLRNYVWADNGEPCGVKIESEGE